MKILEVFLGDNVYAELAMSPSYWQHLSITLDLGYKATLFLPRVFESLSQKLADLSTLGTWFS